MPDRSRIGWVRTRLAHRKCSGAPRISGLKAKACRTDWSRLASMPLPAIAPLRDGGFLLVAKADAEKVLVQSPLAPRPVLMTRDELTAVWDGGLILMARRAGLSDVTRRFDVSLVSGGDTQVSPSADRGPARLVLPAIAGSGVAAVLPGGHRQGAGASFAGHSRRSRARAGDHLGLRNHTGNPADLSVLAHHQPHRCRARRAAVPPFAGVADGLFPGPARRRLGGAGARTGEHPQFSHQLGADARHRPVCSLSSSWA